MQTRVLFGIIGALMCMSTATASVIEVPGANDEMNGIYFFAGWKCAQGALSGRIDGVAVFPLAGLIDRPDTESVCNDTNNGWIAQYKEVLDNPNTRISRPRQVYVGPTKRDYAPLDRR